MNATRRQIVSSLPVCLLFGVVAAPTATGQATAKTVHVEQALAAPNETKPASFFWGDYDGDGFDDAFVIGPSGQGQLLRNLGDGTLAETTVEAGLSWFTGLVAPTFANWSDMDLDGDLDLFIGTSIGPSGLFLNEGQGTFTEMAALAGLTHTGADEHGGWLDYDQDGLPDLHVRTKTESLLYRNVGGAAFERVELGLAPTAPSRVTLVATTGATPAVKEVATTSKSTPADETAGTNSPAPAPMSEADDSVSSAPPTTARTASSITTTTPSKATPTGTVSLSAPTSQPGSVLPVISGTGTLAACAVGIEDQANPGVSSCLMASSAPTIGMLYPLSSDLFVSVTGDVGIGTASPLAKLDVAGAIAVNGVPVIDGGGQWVGDPTGLAGPPIPPVELVLDGIPLRVQSVGVAGAQNTGFVANATHTDSTLGTSDAVSVRATSTADLNSGDPNATGIEVDVLASIANSITTNAVTARELDIGVASEADFFTSAGTFLCIDAMGIEVDVDADSDWICHWARHKHRRLFRCPRH